MNRSEKEILIAGITPYFLERGFLWFAKNKNKIKRARKRQSFFQENTLFLEKDQELRISHLIRKIDELGYEKVQTIDVPGEFSQLGGIVEIFPVNRRNAVRLDFLGNKITNIEILKKGVKREKESKDLLKKKLRSQKKYSDLKGIKQGDCLVHLDHGIGVFQGFEKFKEKEYFLLEYAQGDRLFVPKGLERKLTRYVGFLDPPISRLNATTWQKTKRKTREEAEKLAKELLKIYSRKETTTRPPYPSEDEFDSQLAASFLYNETPDQAEAIEDIKRDLEKEKPMDRVVCGDVGFGKTEVALRAAVRVAKSGRQAVLISPTTILANQHYQNFKERLRDLPFKISLLTRFQKNQQEVMRDIKENRTDIIVGTHRLLSEDIAPLLFQKENSGLLIIDDEQRFGVKQKEKLKKLRGSLDVLSLSATPIPRTLHLALSSFKEISLIQTPPPGRLPTKTFVLPYSLKTIKKAINKEIKRGGQIYYLHNRVRSIEKARQRFQKIFPRLKIGLAHGAMKENELLENIYSLEKGKIDMLIATTIIENGIDLKNVNTLIVEEASKLGLAQAYQIRGRVGRSCKESFAYFLSGSKLTPKARKRLRALEKANQPGSGYRVALKDLEIRGAGNVLGKEQSGTINRVGLNLYCQMISQAVEKIRKSPTE